MVSHTVYVGDVPDGQRAPRTLEEIMAFKARVSNPGNQFNHMTGQQLIEYCIRKRHWSVLQMSDICLKVEADRATLRQLLRHSFDFQEFSFRYADVDGSRGFVTREARLQSETNRQSSYVATDQQLVSDWTDLQQAFIDVSLETYTWARERGIARELARAVLPEGLLLSRMYVKGSFRTWYHYLQVRLRRETQKEHRDLAQACYDEVLKLVPSLDKLLHVVSEPTTLTFNLEYLPTDPQGAFSRLLHKVLPKIFKEMQVYHREMAFNANLSWQELSESNQKVEVHVVIGLKHILDVMIGECWVGRHPKRHAKVLDRNFEKMDYRGVSYWIRIS